MEQFGAIMFTETVKAEQSARGSRQMCDRLAEREAPTGLSQDERLFIETRDSFYMASVSETGWPYVQHRGGPRGFLKVLGRDQIGFADYRGNRQYVSTGNIAMDDRVSLFLMDYPRKARLKLLGHARTVDPSDDPETADRLSTDGGGKVERLVLITIRAFDWNCPQFINTRLTDAEVADALGPKFNALQQRIVDLEAELAAIKGG